MSDTVAKALVLWGLPDPDWHLFAARENRVYRVNSDGQAYALRLHRPGYHSDDELWSELEWMNAVAARGLHVPEPVRSATGEFLHTVDGIQVDMLTWLTGTPVGKNGELLALDDRTGVFHRIGREMARLHTASDAWTPPAGFTRWAWDRKGLLGECPVWDRFWDNPTLSNEDRTLFAKVRNYAGECLEKIEADLDYGLIHADLVRENVLVDGEKLQLIDFDDAGFGFRLFDLATALVKNLEEPDYPALRTALIQGYENQRTIDTGPLDLFILLRALTYVGWISTRLHEPGADLRNTRLVTTAQTLAKAYLTD